MADALYIPLGGNRFRATEHTEGPWSTTQQHGGPPAALLAHAMERTAPTDWIVPLVTVDYLSPVPVAEVEVSVEVVKDGRRSQYLVAQLHAGDRVVARGRAWRIPGDESPGGVTVPPEIPAFIPSEPTYGLEANFQFGFLRAVDWHFVTGSFTAPGPATVWARLRVPLIAEEETSPLERLLTLCDSASGVSFELDSRRHLFSNLDLSAHLYRQPEGEWLCLDAVSTIGQQGSGLCRTVLFDEKGGLGTANQCLFVAPRPQ